MTTGHWFEDAHLHFHHLQEAERGNVRLSRVVVDEQMAKAGAMRAIITQSCRSVPEGTYWQLHVGGQLMMSDTPDELRDLIEHGAACRRHGGRVLITGLGLGCAVAIAAAEPKVTQVTVIELDPGVIALVGPALAATFGSKVDIVQGDAFEWRPAKDEVFSIAWHDIWPDLCTDNLTEMGKLRRRFARRVANGQGCWGEYQCRRYARAGR